MADLLETITALLTPDRIQKAAAMVGESPASTQKSFSILVPTILAGLVKLLSSDTGASQLLSLLVPAVLVLLGFRRLLIEGGVHPPRWYDFMWFGFATYLMLNNPTMAKELEPVVEASFEGL